MYRRSLILICWCPDPIKILTRTKVGGFCPGQMINLDMFVDNQSAIPISKLTVHLIRVRINKQIYLNEEFLLILRFGFSCLYFSKSPILSRETVKIDESKQLL